jgi:hypothetical protein
MMAESSQTKSNCGECPMRARAEKNPKALLSRLWRWHTTWCPGWKAYQKDLAAQAASAGERDFG